MLSWQFSNLQASTGSSPGQNLPGLGPDRPGARVAQCTSSFGCSPASNPYWAAGGAFQASRLQLNGTADYGIPSSIAARSTGNVDLLSIYPASSLVDGQLSLDGLVQEWLGRPYWPSESRGAHAEFDVVGSASVVLTAWVTVAFTPPTDPQVPAVPEPTSAALMGSGLVFLARIVKSRNG